MDRFVVISGCSGGGKSTLLAELKRRGHAVIEEPGRRIISEERPRSGQALPWVDLAAFARRAIAMALEDRQRAMRLPGTVFFDRGLIDAAAALEHATGQPVLRSYAADRYHPLVFMTPPWPDIYPVDPDRPHGLNEATEEYDRLLRAYALLGYRIALLPKAPVSVRADLVVERLGI